MRIHLALLACLFVPNLLPADTPTAPPRAVQSLYLKELIHRAWLETHYAEKHPSMQRAMARIDSIETDFPNLSADSLDPAVIERAYSEATIALHELLEKYREKHPEVLAQRRALQHIVEIHEATPTHDREFLQATLADLRAERRALQLKYREKHPKLLSVNARIQACEQLLLDAK
ncbi:MAG: hypothetical protein ACFBZ8_13645 [Opitutales bacterium]